jgi:hypothetical protein
MEKTQSTYVQSGGVKHEKQKATTKNVDSSF